MCRPILHCLQAKAPLAEDALPEGVDRRCVRPRVGRGGRLFFDRCDAFSLAPLYDVLESPPEGKDGKEGPGTPQVTNHFLGLLRTSRLREGR